MTRVSLFNSPLLLGFDHFERVLDRISKAADDGYPPYNVEQFDAGRLRITLAVAGFAMDELNVTVEENQLIVRGKREEDGDGTYLYRGIAARQFHRAFLLAEGIEVVGATLENGLLHIDLVRPIPEPKQKTVTIQSAASRGRGKHKSLEATCAEPADEGS